MEEHVHDLWVESSTTAAYMVGSELDSGEYSEYNLNWVKFYLNLN